ncbi:MAG: ectoine/hydroxyectoine ABC transporter permease subunit EhuD [Firmicutes bacterium]|nr:ectoine/hydroxyectoine ABC transporter permease subunit EhuD [Bacillota bacterium]
MWDWEFAFYVMPDILKAIRVTIAATLAGFALALAVGLALALLRRSAFKPLSLATIGFIEFVRSTPLLIQLFFIFYALPLSTGISFSAFQAGTIGLGFHYGTYLSEVYRSGIDAIPRGQWEAATALNFSRLRTWTKIILPQAIPPTVPVMGNYLIAMFKETPLLSAITLVEMLQTAKIIGSDCYRYLEPFTLVGIFFLLLSYPASVLVKRLEFQLKQQ